MTHSVPLPGSDFHALDRPHPGHQRARQLTPREAQSPIDLTVMLRERPGSPTVEQSLTWLGALGRSGEDIPFQHGFSRADRDRVVAWARANGVQVLAEDATTRRLTLRAPGARAASLFGVHLERMRYNDRSGAVEYRGHLGPVRVPAAIADCIDGVFGLDDRPIARPRMRTLDEDGRPGIVSYDPSEIARIYRYPRLPDDGAGLHLVAAMIELGGVTHDSDIGESFARLGLSKPELVHVRVDG
ncbi:MAG: hypothetical protein JOY80_08970, partial [Candidatus Dormibacteraeota bacterium]|nr:hypothetical protein [Candidatus Dormibacteraeota bacterium]